MRAVPFGGSGEIDDIQGQLDIQSVCRRPPEPRLPRECSGGLWTWAPGPGSATGMAHTRCRKNSFQQRVFSSCSQPGFFSSALGFRGIFAMPSSAREPKQTRQGITRHHS